MADLSTIRIPVDSSDVTKAVSLTRSLELKFRNLVRQTDVGSTQYKRGLAEIAKAYERLGISSRKATIEIERHAREISKTDQLTRYANKQQEISNKLIHGDTVVKRLNTDMQVLTERYRQGTLTAQQHQTALVALARQLAINNGYTTASGALNTQKALAELRAAQATRDATAAMTAANAAAAAHAQRVNDLRMKYQAGYAEFVRARQVIRELNQAKREGIITTQQYRDKIAALRDAYRNLNPALNQASLGLNRTAVITQQAGYQVGDFFVQVQSGTNILVAFGQQATQLIGTFAMLATSTRTIMMLSGLGVLVAIGTAIGAAMMRASGQTENLSQKMQKLESTGDSLLATFNLLGEDNLSLRFGNLADEVDGLANSMLALDRAAQVRTLLETLDKLEEASRAGFLRQMGQGALNIGRVIVPFGEFYKTTEEVNEEFFNRLGFDMAREQYLAYIDELSGLATQGDIEGVVAAFDRMIADAVDGSDNISQAVSAQGYALADSIRTSTLSLAELVAELNGSAAAARELEEERKRAEQQEGDRNRYLQERIEYINRGLGIMKEDRLEAEAILASYQDQVALQTLINQYGEDHVAVQRLREQQERKTVEAQVEALNITDEMRQKILDAYDASVRLSQVPVGNAFEGALSSIDAMNSRLDVTLAKLGGILSAIGSIGFDIIATRAETAALQAGMTQAQARIEGQYAAEVAGGPQSGLAGLANRLVAGANRVARQELLAAQEAQAAAIAAMTPTGGGRTGGGGQAEEQEDLLQQLSERIAKEQELLTLTDAQKQVVQALGDQYGNYSAEQISQVEAQIEAFNRLVEAQKQQQEILNTVDSAMTDAFMSMVTGAKTAEEAFADMARSIIAKLYEMLVVQQIVNAAMGFLQGPTAALTGAPTTGNFGGGRASGGTIMPGTPYLVGEQGPELIVPRHSGTVVNAANTNSAMKSGETVVVNNNISVTGSDAAMVRAEVTKMIPQITEASKAAVINARQRGGQMRATFGG